MARAIVQRVSEASVHVDGRPVGQIGQGLLILVGVGDGDVDWDVTRLADKIAGLRVFEDSAGKMNLSTSDVDGEMLAVSQFTLYGDVRKGRRPSFIGAAGSDLGRRLYDRFAERLEEHGYRVARGEFGAHMRVALINDGPVTLWLDSAHL